MQFSCHYFYININKYLDTSINLCYIISIKNGGDTMENLNFRRVAGSALAHGCESWKKRISSHSWSGCVIAAYFSTLENARKFSCRWAGVAYKFRALRRVGDRFVVSVPVEMAV